LKDKDPNPKPNPRTPLSNQTFMPRQEEMQKKKKKEQEEDKRSIIERKAVFEPMPKQVL